MQKIKEYNNAKLMCGGGYWLGYKVYTHAVEVDAFLDKMVDGRLLFCTEHLHPSRILSHPLLFILLFRIYQS
jgi:hypothetical protein